MANKPYDPINSIEGMFNGCITRIAQAIKDPINFGPSTKGVLLECSKRFHDALDDCEVQILEAKFYREHQLEQNHAQREAKAREASAASAKRKHDEIKDAEEQEEAIKRIKLAEPQAAEFVEQPAPTKAPTPDGQTLKPEENPSDPPKAPEPTNLLPPKAIDTAPSKPPEEQPPPIVDDFPRPTPNATPAPTNDDFNFESMFGEPSGDVGTDGNDNDITFDLNLTDDFANPLDSAADNPQNQDLNSLLPGLESYANQANDEAGDQGNPSTMNFDLPPLPNLGPNDFDAFLDANDFTTGGDVNLTDDIENLDNVDFDSMFNN